MAAAEVTVQRLRLRARLPVPGLLPNVEDALRVSTKPAALLNRLVLVRRLRLRAAAGASAQAMALQLERAWLQLSAQAQPLEQASDPAEAVWAPSLAVAHQALLRRRLSGEATAAWFWQRLAPTHAGGSWPELALALMLAVDEEAASAAAFTVQRNQALQARALLALIAAHGMTVQLVEALSDAQALAVLRVIHALEEAPAWAHQRLHAASPVPREATPRARLFEIMRATSAVAASSPVQHRFGSSIECTPAPLGKDTPAKKVDEPAWRSTHVPAMVADAKAPRESAAASESRTVLDHGLPSNWSGLWLLLPLLLRLGLDDTDDPLAAWAGAMRAACQRLRIPGDDPVRNALASLDAPPAEDAHWLRTARLAAVHDARLPLLRLARRRGTAWVSPERIDVEFPPASLDLRIRHAGFDINPGFVPWLGRIVHFHYPS
jgi:hypothetical protein